jgi:hypothetical protein
LQRLVRLMAEIGVRYRFAEGLIEA